MGKHHEKRLLVDGGYGFAAFVKDHSLNEGLSLGTAASRTLDAAVLK